METADIKNILKTVGIPLGVAVLILGVGVGFLAYRNYLEAVKLKLEIKELRKDLAD